MIPESDDVTTYRVMIGRLTSDGRPALLCSLCHQVLTAANDDGDLGDGWALINANVQHWALHQLRVGR